MLEIIILYLTLSGLTYIYYLSTSTGRSKKIKYIVVLSASTDYLTKTRIRKAIILSDQHPNSILIICGKEKSQLMKRMLNEAKINKVIIQDSSTNTYEDAFFCNKLVNSNGHILLVTHASHARRSRHTFEKLFKNRISVLPTTKFFAIDSCLLPSGWLSSLINLSKDIKYNHRI